jgi:DNA primase large subunit
MNIEEEVEESRTCDLYQAASLVTAGCKMKRYTLDRGRVYFHFDNNGGLVQRLIREYLSHSLDVNALSMVDNIRALKSLCAEVLNSRNTRTNKG